MKTLIHTIQGILLAFFLTAVAPGATLEGECVAVADGDTATVQVKSTGKREKVRFWGIDAPESTQHYGEEAKSKLSTLVLHKTVRVEYEERDKYHRILGHVYVAGLYVNLEMVKVGCAWHYVKYAPDATDIRQAEETAKSARLGLWADAAPLPPWEYRHPSSPEVAVKAAAGESAEESEEVQYWVSSTSKVHRAGCRYYGKGNGYKTSNPSGPNCKICGGKR